MKAHKLAIAMIAAALTLVWAIGGWAMAGPKHASPTKVATVTQPATVKHVKTTVGTTATATDTDSVQSGDQTGTDTPAEVAGETSGSEAATAEEPGDQNLPGGGHADPAGQDVQHEFNGVE